MATRPPLHIGMFLPDLSFGGVEQVVLRLTRGFLDRAVTVDLVVANGEGAAKSQVPAGVRLIDLGRGRTVAALPGLARYLRSRRPDVLVSAKDHANVVAVLAAATTRVPVPVVATVHSCPSAALPESTRRSGAVVQRLLPWAHRRAAAVVAVSEGVADDVRRLAGGHPVDVTVIRSPVITPELLAEGAAEVDHPWFTRPRDVPIVVWCGRLAAEKDPLHALDAFARAAADRPMRLVFVGDGPLRVEVTRAAARLGLADAVEVLGYREHPAPYLAGADLFVLSSRREGMPTVLVEALALGTRAVATDCESGPRELLGRDAPGALAPVGDAAALAAAMLRTLDDPRPTLPAGALAEFEQSCATGHYLDLVQRVRGMR